MANIIKPTNTPKTIQRLDISACILAKNDENLIEDCIKSIKDYVKEIIVVDLGSTDATVTIAREYTSRIYRHIWNNDYGDARNTFLKYVSQDWVFYMDAHERLTPDSHKLLTPEFLDKKNAVAYMVKVNEMFQDKEVEIYSCRLFRRTKDIRFKWVIHESVTDDVQKVARKENLDIVRSELEINRYNYLRYFDESELHMELITIARHGLENAKLEASIKAFYKLCLGLSLNAIGEKEDAEEEIAEVLEEIRKMDTKTVSSIPLFIQPFIFFAFKYSKQEKYEEAYKIMEEGVNIYPNSLTMLIRYCEVLFALNRYKDCLDHIAKIKMLEKDEKFYQLEPMDFTFIHRLSNKLENLAYDRYEALLPE